MSLDLDITGVVHKVGEVKQITDTFQKIDAIITVDEIGGNGQTYTQHIALEVKQKACEYWSAINVGDTVTVKCHLRGRLYTRRDTGEEASFTSIDAWRVDVAPQVSDVPSLGHPEAPPAPRPPGVLPNEDEQTDDIPF